MAELAAKILKDEGIPIENMRQHHDFDTKNRKNCPAQIRAGKDGINWNEFVQMVKDNMKGTAVTKPVSTPVPSKVSGKTVEVGKQATHWQNGASIPSFVKGQTYDVIEEKTVNQSNSKKAFLIGKGKTVTGWLLEQDVEGFKATTVPTTTEPQPTGNPVIRDIQRMVGAKEDGWDGPDTRKCVVKVIQRCFSAHDDGYVGDETLRKSITIRYGDRGWHVYALQAMLYLKGYSVVGTPDQIAGKNTVQAIKDFQRANGLLVDGIAGRNTYAKLLKL